MFDKAAEDVFAVYNRLKDRYPLILTNSMALDEGFTVDCPVIVAKAHGQIMELYEDGGVFILDVMDEAKTKGTHWHPYDVEDAAKDFTEFMEGKSDYGLTPFRRPQRRREPPCFF